MWELKKNSPFPQKFYLTFKKFYDIIFIERTLKKKKKKQNKKKQKKKEKRKLK